ncbi:MAG: adenylate kinase [Anaerolineaceae bacterium]|nr:adenylate kinase [Anaerolineaceae bacterium]
MARYIVLLGPPGAGKGTQAQRIAEEYGLVHVSSGDLFRENLKAETELGKHAKTFIDRGELVPDDVTIGMIRERLSRPDCEQGALLDGFPRTPAQAEALSVMLREFNAAVNLVPFISVPEEILVSRLSGRWTCRASGHVYHESFNPPAKPGVCDLDGSDLYQRDDDKPETVLNRIKVYQEQTAPLIRFYQENGLLVEIDGTKPIDEVSTALLHAIKKA